MRPKWNQRPILPDDRVYSYKPSPDRDKRPLFRRDRDKILYSSAFKRLTDVTQVVGVSDAHVFHNRLTHSLQVAQVGQSIAERLCLEQGSLVEALGGPNPDVVQAACLAHDLGHPPFGHTAEKTVEAEIMDWADTVTYAVHDVEDFYRAGRIPLHLLRRRRGRELQAFFDEVFRRRQKEGGIWKRYKRSRLEEAFLNWLLLFQIDEPYVGTQAHRTKLRRFSAECIEKFVNALRLRRPNKRTEACVEVDPTVEVQVTMLKELTWHYVIENPSMGAQRHGQRRVISDLFGFFHQAAQNGEFHVFPALYRERLRSQPRWNKTRLVLDLVSGMTERQAMSMHHRITGASLSATFEGIP